MWAGSCSHKLTVAMQMGLQMANGKGKCGGGWQFPKVRVKEGEGRKGRRTIQWPIVES